MSLFFFFEQKTAYEMRISDWSSDVCSSDLLGRAARVLQALAPVNGFGGAFFGQLRALALLVELVAQLGGGELEDRLVVVVIGDHAVDRLLGAVEHLGVLRGLAGVAVAGLGEHV